jgi:hypothetical protein
MGGPPPRSSGCSKSTSIGRGRKSRRPYRSANRMTRSYCGSLMVASRPSARSGRGDHEPPAERCQTRTRGQFGSMTRITSTLGIVWYSGTLSMRSISAVVPDRISAISRGWSASSESSGGFPRSIPKSACRLFVCPGVRGNVSMVNTEHLACPASALPKRRMWGLSEILCEGSISLDPSTRR